MSRQRSDQGPVTFHDVAAYFSDEEWKLLHEWQKELYKNVMNEIHQALTSLGPLIATSVFSLRAKEKEDLCQVGNQDSERRYSVNHPTSDAHCNADVPFGINQETTQYLLEPQDTDRRKSNHCLSTEDEAIFPIVTFMIKEEGDTGYMDHQDCKRRESIDNTTGDPVVLGDLSLSVKPGERTYFQEELQPERRTRVNVNMKKTITSGYSVACAEKATLCKTSGRSKTEVPQSTNKGTHSRSQLCPESKQEPEGETATVCLSGFKNLDDYNVNQGSPVRSDPDECENIISKAKGLTCQAKKQMICVTDTLNGYEERFDIQGALTNNPRSNEKERPYQCTECEKSFMQRAHLIRHQKTHTGQRPYVCTECGRSFSQKINHIRHQRTHTGERPFHCTECGKSFSHKHHLIGHQRTHTGVRPYQCTKCMKSFIWKDSLTRHQRTHINVAETNNIFTLRSEWSNCAM